MNAYLNQYQNNQIQTASPAQLLIMFYDGAIRSVKEAAVAIPAGQMERKGKAISKCIALVSELSATLDHKIGGEIASNLEALYDFMIRELTQANLKNDPDRLQVVQKMLEELRETWIEAIGMVQSGRSQVEHEQSPAKTGHLHVANMR